MSPQERQDAITQASKQVVEAVAAGKRSEALAAQERMYSLIRTRPQDEQGAMDAGIMARIGGAA